MNEKYNETDSLLPLHMDNLFIASLATLLINFMKMIVMVLSDVYKMSFKKTENIFSSIINKSLGNTKL